VLLSLSNETSAPDELRMSMIGRRKEGLGRFRLNSTQIVFVLLLLPVAFIGCSARLFILFAGALAGAFGSYPARSFGGVLGSKWPAKPMHSVLRTTTAEVMSVEKRKTRLSKRCRRSPKTKQTGEQAK